MVSAAKILRTFSCGHYAGGSCGVRGKCVKFDSRAISESGGARLEKGIEKFLCKRSQIMIFGGADE